MPVKLNDAEMRVGRPAACECPTRCLQRFPPAVALRDFVKCIMLGERSSPLNINFALLEPLRHPQGAMLKVVAATSNILPLPHKDQSSNKSYLDQETRKQEEDDTMDGKGKH